MGGWEDELLAGTEIPRSMNLHYGKNAVVDYGLHDEDGGKIIYPFFTTDEGFLRTRVEQNTDALEDKLYEGSSNTANWDNLSGRDLTSLFSLCRRRPESCGSAKPYTEKACPLKTIPTTSLSKSL